MLQVLLNNQGAVLAQLPRPAVQAGSVLVKVHYSMISVGTELAGLRQIEQPMVSTPTKIITGYPQIALIYLQKALRNPRKAAKHLKQIIRQRIPKDHSKKDLEPEINPTGWNVGYSAAGEVIAVGTDIQDFKPGDLVACAGAGKANHAEYISVPRQLVCRVPANVEMKSAASTTLGTIALQGIRRANPRLGEQVAVLGLGLLGQLTVQMLNANGCHVLGLDLNEERVQRAKDLGLKAGCSEPEAFKKVIHDLTQGHGVDCTFITAATPSHQVINLAMDVTRRKGTVVVVGDVGLHVERAQFYRKEIDLLISSSYGPGRYDPTYEELGQDYPYGYVRWTMNRNMQAYLELLSLQRINVRALIDRIVPIHEAKEIYHELATQNDNLPLGVVLSYQGKDVEKQDEVPTRIHLQNFKEPKKDKINYVLVGAGAFGTSLLVPKMEKLKDLFSLRGVVSRDAVRGGQFAHQYHLELFASELSPVLADPEIDLLVIATRHHDHASQVIAGLKAGKHVFVEKPLALTWQELADIVTTYEQLEEKPLLMVGFNRRFSKAMQMLKQTLAERRSPLVINYRLHGGYIPFDHWIQNFQGGGRNLGEACHMYDCFRFLCDNEVTDIQAMSIDPRDLPYLRNDNFTASCRYADGSVANLVYTALGPKQNLNKEYIEVFCDNEAYIIDDYSSLRRASDGKILWSGEVDKGHAEQLTLLGEAIKNGGDRPIDFETLTETSAVALMVEDLLFHRDQELLQHA